MVHPRVADGRVEVVGGRGSGGSRRGRAAVGRGAGGGRGPAAVGGSGRAGGPPRRRPGGPRGPRR